MAGPNVVNVALGFLVFMLVLVELHGFSTVGAVFAIPAVIFSGILLFISHLLGLLTTFFIGSLSGGVMGLLVLGLGLALVSRSLVAFTAQSYMLLAIFLVLLLLVA